MSSIIKNKFFLLCLVIVLTGAGVAGGYFLSQKNTSTGKVVGKVGSRTITVDDINRVLRIQLKNETASFLNLNPENQRLLFDRMVKYYVSIDAAKKEGMGKNPEIEKRVEVYHDQLLRGAYLKRLAQEPITDDQVRAAYQVKAQELQSKKQYRFRQIVLSSKEDAHQIMTRLATEPFPQLAQQYSISKVSAKRGGDMGFVLETHINPEVLMALQSPNATQEARLINIGKNWHIIQLLTVRNAQILPYEKISNTLRQSILTERINNHLEQLKKKSEVQYLWGEGRS